MTTEEKDIKMAIVDLVLREYKSKQFDEVVWRMKWEDFIHPDTQESGTEYLDRMKDQLPLNPTLQKDRPIIIVLEPLYGPVED
jgi:hypothetical protein